MVMFFGGGHGDYYSADLASQTCSPGIELLLKMSSKTHIENVQNSCYKIETDRRIKPETQVFCPVMRPLHVRCYVLHYVLRLRDTGRMDTRHCAHSWLKMYCEQLARTYSTVYYFSRTI